MNGIETHKTGGGGLAGRLRCAFRMATDGVTLVEVLVSLVILLFVSMALMATALVSIESNTKNQLRDEAVRIAEERFEQLRGAPYGDLASDYHGIENVNVMVRNMSFTFSQNTVIAPLANATRIGVTVSWIWKGVAVEPHSIATIRREED